MSPQEKAIDLVNKFKYNTRAYSEDKQWEDTAYNAKQCALIAVDEILDIDCFDMSEEHFDNHIEYWQQVKQEIEKL
jgi:hypothetical protein